MSGGQDSDGEHPTPPKAQPFLPLSLRVSLPGAVSERKRGPWKAVVTPEGESRNLQEQDGGKAAAGVCGTPPNACRLRWPRRPRLDHLPRQALTASPSHPGRRSVPERPRERGARSAGGGRTRGPSTAPLPKGAVAPRLTVPEDRLRLQTRDDAGNKPGRPRPFSPADFRPLWAAWSLRRLGGSQLSHLSSCEGAGPEREGKPRIQGGRSRSQEGRGHILGGRGQGRAGPGPTTTENKCQQVC